MANAVLEMQATMKRNSDDLREELDSLAQWEDEVKAENNAKKKTHGKNDLGVPPQQQDLPPIRGTAPLVKPKTTPKVDHTIEAKDEGNEYYRRNKFDDAIRSYTKGINLDPNNSNTHILYANRAMCHLKVQHWAAAEADATTCVGMNRAYFKAFFRRALARRALGKLEEAVSDLQTVLVLSPGDAESQKELKAVNELLQQKRAQEGSAAQSSSGSSAVPAAKKKLVIEEVDDDEEEDDEEAAAAAALAAKKKQEAVKEELAGQEAQRLRAENEKKKAEHEAAVAAAAKKVRKNAKIEEIEDEEESPKKAPAPTKKASPAKQDFAPRKLQSTWTEENLQAPKNFIEFEKMHNELHKDQKLFGAYLKKVNLSNFSSLIGSSMTSELMVSILKTATVDANRTFAAELVTALSTIRRLDEIILFLEEDEKAILQKALGSVDVSPSVKKRFD